ncbi:sericin 1-like protein [Carex littledalei]|uniref:Sericin 1-like protein n=1 Tax=Carex littledalei TaxID=544730 RepID=A0A833VM38_9POAL|nr:sericin 1-like protein [Carex littledalei]
MHHTKSKISGMIHKGFKAEKCKVSLRMAMSRMKLARNKREVQVRQMRRDVARLLQAGQDQTARIRVEHVIREEKTMAAYELLELYCELIVARLPIIDSQKTCPVDLQEAISSVIFASPRCADVQELMDVRQQFLSKYGKEFTTAALELRPECGVSHMVIEKLSAKTPDIETKIKTLKSIAEEHGIEWDSKALLDELKPKNDLLTGSTQFPSASQVAMNHSATSSVNTSSQPKPTQFLSASQVAMDHFSNNSSADTVQTSSQPKPTQFLSASEVITGHSSISSGTGASTGQIPIAQPKNGDPTESDVAKPPDDQVHPHGGIISSTGSIIYPPPPPPFMRFEESAPSSTQADFTSSPDGTSRQEKTKQKYKDAKEAARAAAESAERAQMAARAAAELARHGNKARRKAQGEGDLGSVEDTHRQSEMENLNMPNDQIRQEFQSDEEEEGEEERENEYDITWDKHEPSSVAVFDQGDSDIEDHSTNLLDNFSQPKEEYISNNFYWNEKADSKKQDRSENVFFEDSRKDSSPPRFVSSSAPTFDSDGEDEGDVKIKKEQPKFNYNERRKENEDVFASDMKSTRVSYDDDDDDDEPALGLPFGKLTGGLKNKGYRQPPYVSKPIIDATPSVETLDDHDMVSMKTEKTQRGSKDLASRFDASYFDSEDEVEEPENQPVQDIGRHANKNIVKHSRRTRDAISSKIRKEDNIHFGENQYPESSDEETTNESVVAEKSELEDQTKSSVPSFSTSVRSRRPPDYESLAAHFRSLRTDRP